MARRGPKRGKGRGKLLRAVKRLFVAEETPEPEESARAARRAELTGALSEEDLSRVTRLDAQRQYLLELAGENRNLAGELLQEELAKLEEMVRAFVELAGACARWERHLKGIDWEELDSDTRRHERDAAKALDPEHRALARRNLEVLRRRREQLDDLVRRVTKTRAQLD